ncbi:hypothetical protein [Mangrovibacterium sp.]|uniref:hypothetical protein n=1 Tax=Mangrovibacterium sp. TaxID=1961364 RepID=UPI0035664B50
MKVQFQTQAKTNIKSPQQDQHLRNKSTKPHYPLPTSSGLRCEGDRFGYIVDWQVTDKPAPKS